MANQQQEQQSRTTLETVLKKIIAHDEEKLMREDLGADLNFSKGRAEIHRAVALYRAFAAINLELLPYTALQAAQVCANEIASTLDAIATFSLAKHQNSPLQSRDALIQQAMDNYDKAYKELAPHIAYSIRKGTDFGQLEKEAKDALAIVRETQKQMESEMTTGRSQAEATLETIRKAAAEAGVAQHAIHFKDEADGHGKIAEKWLKASGWVAGGLAAFLLLNVLYYAFRTVTMTAEQTAHLVVMKLALFSLLTYVLVWTSRVYRSHKHNEVVNRHRQNALGTFQAFAKAAEADQQIKHAVLLQATQCVFTAQPSGYLGQEGEAQPKVLEIVRDVISPDKH